MGLRRGGAQREPCHGTLCRLFAHPRYQSVARARTVDGMRSVEQSMFTITPAGLGRWLVTVYRGDGQVTEKWMFGPRLRAKRAGYRLLRDYHPAA